MLLDLGLPDGDGKDVIRRSREWSDVPIIVLSAREREIEKIEALDLGADDYVNKPFNVGELLARMRTATSQEAIFMSDATSQTLYFYNRHRISCDIILCQDKSKPWASRWPASRRFISIRSGSLWRPRSDR